MRGVLIISFCCSLVASAQLQLDVPLRSTDVNGNAGVIGLAAPVNESAGISVEVAASGILHWAVASPVEDTLVLSVSPSTEGYSDGLLLRFVTPEAGRAMGWIKVDELPAALVVRPDGLPIGPSTMRTGAIAEVLFHDGRWVLLNAERGSCPAGALAVNERLCVDAGSTPGLGFYQAIERCGAKGGKLCTWDEYIAACSLLGSSLNGLFDEWEWIDDTSNHTHTADQAGRFTCQSQRTANAIHLVVGDVRCCYHPR